MNPGPSILGVTGPGFLIRFLITVLKPLQYISRVISPFHLGPLKIRELGCLGSGVEKRLYQNARFRVYMGFRAYRVQGFGWV